MTSKFKDLREPGPIAVASEGRTRREIALLNAPMAQVDRLRHGLVVANRRKRKDQLDIGPQLWLVLFDDHDIIAPLVDNRLCAVALGQEGIHGDNPTFQDQLLSEGLDGCDLIGCVVNSVLGEGDTYMVCQGR
jgi:hypothetical protein